METAKNALSQMKKGHATTMWGLTVIRIADRATAKPTLE